MKRLTIITFLFSQPRKWRQLRFGLYKPRYVNALWRACEDNIRIPHRFLCITEDPTGIECETAPAWPAIFVRGEDACYRRLHAFDPEWQASLGTDWILSMDLDAAFLGDMTDSIERAMAASDFRIMRGSSWPDGTLCAHYNGSIWLCRNGARPHFWRDFDPAIFHSQRETYRMPNGRRPHGSDQAWITVRAGDSESTFGANSGIYQYRNVREAIPENARLLFFAGIQKPWGREVRSARPDIHEAWARYDVLSAGGVAEEETQVCSAEA